MNQKLPSTVRRLPRNLGGQLPAPKPRWSTVKSLPSFTMLELITVLAISTIVIGMAYMAYELIYKDFLDYKEETTNTLATMDFITILERDINNADSIYVYQDEWILHQNNQPIIYLFEADKVTKILDDNRTAYFEIETTDIEQWQYLLPQNQTKKVIFE